MWRNQAEQEADDGSRRRLHGDGGSAAVEFAFVLPFLVGILFAIYTFGLAYNAKTELTGAAREGARSAALGKDTTTVTNTVKDAAPGLVRNNVLVTVANPKCDKDQPGVGDAKVTVTYDMSFSIPFWRSGTWTLRSDGVMRCGL